MKVKVNKYTFLDICAMASILFCLLSVVYPPVVLIGNNAMICLGCEVLWFLVALIQSQKTMLKLLSQNILGVLMLAYMVLLPYIFNNGTIGNRYTNIAILVFGLMMYGYYTSTNRQNVLKFPILCSIPFFCITYVKTLNAALTNPWIIRSINQSGSDRSLIRQGVGGYHFIYFLTLLFALFFVNFLVNINKRIKIVSALFCFACLCLIAASNFFTGLLICIVVMLIACIVQLTQQKINASGVMKFFVILSFVILAFLIKDTIIEWLLNYLSPTGRIYAVLASSKGSILDSIMAEFLQDRFPVMKLSWDTFLENPLFGLIVKPISTSGEFLTGFGQHSYLLDTFALYGIIVGFINLYVLISPYKKRGFYKDLYPTYRYTMLTVVILLSLFNNITFSIGLASTVLCPYIFTWFNSDRSSGAIIEKRYGEKI